VFFNFEDRRHKSATVVSSCAVSRSTSRKIKRLMVKRPRTAVMIGTFAPKATRLDKRARLHKVINALYRNFAA
jgi:hypothetical protein